MIDEAIFQDLKDLNHNEKISKKQLLHILKKYGKNISVYDLMLAAASMRKGVEFVQEEYQDQFVEPYVKVFILSVKELLDVDFEIEGSIDKGLFEKGLINLEYGYNKGIEDDGLDPNFRLIIAITSLYVTFIKEEPMHPVGSLFPGNLEVYEENGIFYCPVKDAQKDNINALCMFCLAEQTPNIHT
ncbi:MAG: DUF2115 family protein [Methanobrevibacter sp.]|uniref:DUF2115 family protein n=1 Tax=Methanobrevibacter sp. TaxID=66852 RepID=UPI0026DFD565|nr:DUF2115 family protein [Methanobrevibacter sp.]MDO5848307.1 DUF2115 family protein [Methanobrevibacter sp.]